MKMVYILIKTNIILPIMDWQFETESKNIVNFETESKNIVNVKIWIFCWKAEIFF